MTTKKAVAWYRREQWPRLLELAADSVELEPTYDEWLEAATRILLEIDPLGQQTRQVDVDVEQLWRWCQAQGRPLDGQARAAFVAHRAQAEEDPPRADS